MELLITLNNDDGRPNSPYGRRGGRRPRSVGRSRDPSPDRPGSYSPLPSPLYPSGTGTFPFGIVYSALKEKASRRKSIFDNYFLDLPPITLLE